MTALSNEIAAHARETTQIAQLVVTISNDLSLVLGSVMVDLEETASSDRTSIQTSREDVERTMDQFRISLDSARKFIGAMATEGRNSLRGYLWGGPQSAIPGSDQSAHLACHRRDRPHA